MSEERTGGRIALVLGLTHGFAILMGSATAATTPPVGTWITVASVFGLGLVIAIGIGCYNLGRKRGR